MRKTNFGLSSNIYKSLAQLCPISNYEDMVTVLGDDARTHQVVKNWSTEFQAGRTTCRRCWLAPNCVHSRKCCVCDLIKQDRRLTT